MGDKKDNKFGFSEGTAVDLDGGAISEAHEKRKQEQQENPTEQQSVEADAHDDDEEVVAATMAMEANQIASHLKAREAKDSEGADDADDPASDKLLMTPDIPSSELPLAPEVFDDFDDDDEGEAQKTMAMEHPPLPELDDENYSQPPAVPSSDEEEVEKTMAMDTPHIPSDDEEEVEKTMAMDTPDIPPDDDEEEVEKTSAMDLEELSFPADEDDESIPSTMAMDANELSFPADEDDDEGVSLEEDVESKPAVDFPSQDEETNTAPAPVDEPDPPKAVDTNAPTAEQPELSLPGKDALNDSMTAALEEGFSGDSTMMFDASELLLSRADQGPQGVLTVIYGADKDNEYYLQGESTMVGRGLDCDIVVNDRSVSRKHFRIDRRGGEFFLVDLGSGNGTKVNGERVSDIALLDDVQIEAGTTIMSFGYVGSEQRAPAEVQYTVKELDGNLKKIFSGVAVLVLLVGIFAMGESFGWWSLVDKPKPTPTKVTKAPLSKGLKYITKAQEHLAEKELDDAVVALENAQAANVDSKLLSRVQSRLKTAQGHKKQLIRQKNALGRGDYQAVIRDLETIPTTSPFFTEADELRDKAMRKLVEQWKDQAYKLQDDGKNKEAIALLKLVLKENPDDAEASAVIQELGGGKDIAAATAAKVPVEEKPKAENTAPAKPTEKQQAKPKPKPSTKVAKVSPKPTTRKTVKTKSLTLSNSAKNTKSRSSSERANLRRGYKLYSSGKFSEAADYLDGIAQNSQVRRSDRSKARSLADRIVNFASIYRQAKSAVSNFKPSAAIPLLTKARSLDKRISGVFGGEIRRQLAKMYAFKAAGAYSSQKFKEAARMAAKALKLNPGESSARLVQSRVNDKVGALMNQARAAYSQGNFVRARKLCKQLLGILPSSAKRYTEASRMLRNIIAQQADEEDD